LRPPTAALLLLLLCYSKFYCLAETIK